MKVEEITMNHKSTFLNSYLNQDKQSLEFFDYSFLKEEGYSDRLTEIASRQYPKHMLVQHLLQFNHTYKCSAETINNINKLSSEDSVVVIGGQQAGVLTGPLYTIHKIVTILQLAKEKEAQLGIPVTPVFWVAGEDHDFDEINHVYLSSHGHITKQKVSQQNQLKKSVSDLPIDHQSVQSFIQEVFKVLKETGNTKRLRSMLEQFLTESNTYVDFFCYLIHMLFQHSGIVLMDSHHPELRRLEAPFFNKLVSENELLRAAFVEQADLFYEKGFGEPIARSKENTHLFYHTSEGRRILLLKQENGSYVDRDRQYLFDEDQLRLLVEREPEKFSNNVVTRPLMQEFLFPVLAFVAGPGEIAYWATLKKTFHLFGFKVPPVVPRFSMTFIDAKIDKYLKTLNIPLSIVFEKGAKSFWEKAVFEGVAEEIDEALLRVMGDLKAAQLPLVELVEKYEIGLSDMAAKNLKVIQNQVQFLANRVKKGVREKNQRQLLKYEMIDSVVVPTGVLQERLLNIFMYINDYGEEFIHQLLTLQFEMNTKHKIIFL